MNTDFQNILKQLGKQAQKEAAEKQAAEKNKQKQEQDFDFSQAVGQLSPLKNRQQYYAPPDKTALEKIIQSIMPAHAAGAMTNPQDKDAAIWISNIRNGIT
ncbi:hypothetical protein OKE62_09130, partial [Neisseria meningitidis]|nr:hypothetical protein [Neisseria meningitidis]